MAGDSESGPARGLCAGRGIKLVAVARGRPGARAAGELSLTTAGAGPCQLTGLDPSVVHCRAVALVMYFWLH